MYLLFLLVSLLFLVVNLVCALLVRTSSSDAHAIVLVRVAINDTLFVLSAVSLSVCLYKIAKMSLANIYLESKVRSVCPQVGRCPLYSAPVPPGGPNLQLCVRPAGDVRVPGDGGGRHGHPAVLLQGLLQPGGPGTVQQKHQRL